MLGGKGGSSGGGGGGTPGGNNNDVQYNSSGSFAGSDNFTFDGRNVTLLGGTLSAQDGLLAPGVGIVTGLTLTPAAEPGRPAQGTIMMPVPGSITEGDQITITDNVDIGTPTIFQFSFIGDGGGNVLVDISAAVTAADVANDFRSAFSGSELNPYFTVAGGTTVNVDSIASDAGYNVPITGAAEFIIIGLSGGITPDNTTAYTYNVTPLVGATEGALSQFSTANGAGTLITGLYFNTLSWTAVPGATSYNVYESVGPLGNPGLLTNTASTTFTDDGNFPGSGGNAPEIDASTQITTTGPILGGSLNQTSQEIWIGPGAAGGVTATDAPASIMIGAQAGSASSNSPQSIFIGHGAGQGAISCSSSIFVGPNAGLNSISAHNSNYLGEQAGQSSTSNNSNIFGVQAGLNTTGNNLNLFGISAGQGSTSIDNSNMFGNEAGAVASNSSGVNFFGAFAGNGANSNSSNCFGESAGQNSVSANSNMFGSAAGQGVTGDNVNLFGSSAGFNATSISNATFFGNQAGFGAIGSGGSNFFGSFAGYQAISASNNNFFGESAGYGASGTSESNFFGTAAGGGSVNVANCNWFGPAAGEGATNATVSNFFGSGAGQNAVNAFYSNFYGLGAGFGASGANNSIFIGYSAGSGDTVNNAGGHSSILIGDNTLTGGFSDSVALGANLTNTAANQMLLGGSAYRVIIGGTADDGITELQLHGGMLLSGTIVDNLGSQIASIDSNNRKLFWTDGTTTIFDWANGALYRQNTLAAINLETNILVDDSGNNLTSIDWSTRLLNSENNMLGTSVLSLDYQNRLLVASDGTTTGLDWDNGYLYDSSAVIALNWHSRITEDGFGASSSNWNNRTLIAGSGTTTVLDWGNLVLFDASGVASIDWHNRYLYFADGTTIASQWGGGISLNDTTGQGSINVEARLLLSNSGSTVFAWNGGVFIAPTAGTESIDFDSRFLFDVTGNASGLSIKWNDRALIANDGATTNIGWTTPGSVYMPGLIVDGPNASINISGRTLNDTAGTTILDWVNTGYLVYTPTGTGTGTALILTAGNQILPLTSSERFKEEITSARSFEGKNLHAKNYHRLGADFGAKEVGLIAEEAYQIIPEIVNLDEQGKPYSINMNAAIAVLFDKVRDLEEKLAQATAKQAVH